MFQFFNFSIVSMHSFELNTFYYIFTSAYKDCDFKAIFSDSMTWNRGYKYKKKKLISKISLDSNFTFTSYAWFYCAPLHHRLPVELRLVYDNYVQIALNSYWNDFSLIPLENVLFRGELQKDEQNPNFDKFESTLYIKSWECFKAYDF